MGRRIAESIWGVKGEDNKSTGSCSSKKRERKFWVETDASEHTIGAVLLQEQDGKWKSIAFLSRTI